MAKKPHCETIVSALDYMCPNIDENAFRIFLYFIQVTDIPENHEEIIVALEKCIAALPAEWTSILKETIESVLAQKEVAEKVVKYEGTFNFFESDSLMRDLSQVMNPLHGITEISFKAVSTGRLSVAVTFPADFADIIFGSNGLLSNSQWIEKLHQISDPPLRTKKEQTNIIELPDNCILSFEDGRWYHEVEDVEGSKHECYRHEALGLVEINRLKRILTDEAWADIIKPDQPLL